MSTTGLLQMTAPPTGPPLEGYAQFRFTAGDFSHNVYHAGERRHPPLLLMPEIAGFSPGLLQFAARLQQARFQVYAALDFRTFRSAHPDS